tara:strand:- start:240 stop:353 length:114 start_codon:yes stop_codon:yes gene_type:complete
MRTLKIFGFNFVIINMGLELNKVTQGGFEPPTLRAEI